MKISLGTVSIDDDCRRAIWHHFNTVENNSKLDRCPMATREDCRQFIKDEGLGGLETVSFVYAQACETDE